MQLPLFVLAFLKKKPDHLDDTQKTFSTLETIEKKDKIFHVISNNTKKTKLRRKKIKRTNIDPCHFRIKFVFSSCTNCLIINTKSNCQHNHPPDKCNNTQVSISPFFSTPPKMSGILNHL